MVAINITPGQDKDLPEWRAKGKYTFPIAVMPDKDFARTTYDIVGAPTNLVVDGDGRLVFRHLGYGPGAEKRMESEIRDLLGLKPFEGLIEAGKTEAVK